MQNTRARKTTMRGIPVYVNASMIREARMIYQNLFGRHAGPQAKSQSASTQSLNLKCGFCIDVRKKRPHDAITIVNGQAVCHDHMYYAQGGEFARILTLIKRDETGNGRR